MSTPDEETALARERAVRDLEDIVSLKRLPAYERYLKRRLLEVLQRHEQTALTNDSLSDEAILHERYACKVLREEIVNMLEIDEQNHRATVKLSE